MRTALALASRPFTSLVLVAGAAGFAACNAYDAPLPPAPQIVQAAKPPPAISGGTLVMSRSGLAVAADPDRDRVFAVDLAQGKKVADIALESGDEPGRLVEDAAGLFHVSLRASGAVATLDIGAGKVVARKQVCAAPRGLAYDEKLDAIHVACAGGELVTLGATDGKVLRNLRIDSDLRDVVVQGDELWVSRFRSAELLSVSSEGIVSLRVTPPPFMGSGFDSQTGQPATFEPDVAWKTIPMSAGGVAMVHQRAMTTPVKIQVEGGYSGGDTSCDNSIVVGTVSLFRPSGDPANPISAPSGGTNVTASVLPVDLAAHADGSRMAIVSAGSGNVVLASASDFEGQGDLCGNGQQSVPVAGTPVAVAFSPELGGFVVQTREPAGVVVIGAKGTIDQTIDAGGASVADTGHTMFHSNPGGKSALACASCHPEGRDDGRVWHFDPIGARRTPTLGGGVLATAPLHWDGDMSGLDMIMDEVFVKRMGGQVQGPRRVAVFSTWIDALPAFQPNPRDDSAAERGQALFNDATVGCAGCHSGPHFTNNQAKDVGTGRAFQVPPLTGLGARAPYMHDGCAATLKDRFNPACGGSNHGDVSKLTSPQIDDLVAYLDSL